MLQARHETQSTKDTIKREVENTVPRLQHHKTLYMNLKEQEWRVPLPTWTDRKVAHGMTATLPFCDFIDVNKGVYLILKSLPTENDFSLKIMEVAKKHPK